MLCVAVLSYYSHTNRCSMQLLLLILCVLLYQSQPLQFVITIIGTCTHGDLLTGAMEIFLA